MSHLHSLRFDARFTMLISNDGTGIGLVEIYNVH
jgi:hypothetical protein